MTRWIVIGFLSLFATISVAMIADTIRDSNRTWLTSQRECLASGMSFVSASMVVACVDKDHEVSFKRGPLIGNLQP